METLVGVVLLALVVTVVARVVRRSRHHGDGPSGDRGPTPRDASPPVWFFPAVPRHPDRPRPSSRDRSQPSSRRED